MEPGPSFEQTWMSILSDMLYAKFSWNWPGGSGEEGENVNMLRRQRWRQTTDTNFDQKSLLEPSAQVR